MNLFHTGKGTKKRRSLTASGTPFGEFGVNHNSPLKRQQLYFSRKVWEAFEPFPDNKLLGVPFHTPKNWQIPPPSSYDPWNVNASLRR